MSENINTRNLPIYEFILDEEKLLNNELGLKAISIVDQPAIESNFMMFTKQNEMIRELKFANESKNELVGALMMPNMMIYQDQPFEHYGYFSEKTCDRMIENMMQKGLTKNFNIMHNGKKIEEAFIKEIWLEGINAKAIHKTDYPKGTPLANVKVTPKLRQYINENGLKGFSIECTADAIRKFSEIKVNKDHDPSIIQLEDNKQNSFFMTIEQIFNKAVSEMKQVLNMPEDKKDEIKDENKIITPVDEKIVDPAKEEIKTPAKDETKAETPKDNSADILAKVTELENKIKSLQEENSKQLETANLEMSKVKEENTELKNKQEQLVKIVDTISKQPLTDKIPTRTDSVEQEFSKDKQKRKTPEQLFKLVASALESRKI